MRIQWVPRNIHGFVMVRKTPAACFSLSFPLSQRFRRTPRIERPHLEMFFSLPDTPYEYFFFFAVYALRFVFHPALCSSCATRVNPVVLSLRA